MRYRPFGRTGQAISAVSLALGDEPEGESARVRLVYAALEAGVNAFELRTTDPAAARALGKALEAVERRLVLVTLRLDAGDLTPDGLFQAMEAVLLSGRLGLLDAVILNDPGPNAARLLSTIEAARDARRLRLAGASGRGEAEALAGGGFTILSASYNLRSGWAERNRIKRVVEEGHMVIGFGHHPSASSHADEAPPPRGLLGRLRRAPAALERTDAYAFLRQTPGWTADQICLCYALLEPALASVAVEATTAEEIAALAEVAERELPTGLPAQIEMARFAAA